MPYDYQIERASLFTEEGQRQFLVIRDEVRSLLATAGAFQMVKAIRGQVGSSWEHLACVDRLVELGEIREITGSNVAGQHRVFVSARESL